MGAGLRRTPASSASSASATSLSDGVARVAVREQDERGLARRNEREQRLEAAVRADVTPDVHALDALVPPAEAVRARRRGRSRLPHHRHARIGEVEVREAEEVGRGRHEPARRTPRAWVRGVGDGLVARLARHWLYVPLRVRLAEAVAVEPERSGWILTSTATS